MVEEREFILDLACKVDVQSARPYFLGHFGYVEGYSIESWNVALAGCLLYERYPFGEFRLHGQKFFVLTECNCERVLQRRIKVS